jgi:hypothetical protein
MGVVLAVVGVTVQTVIHFFNYLALDERYAEFDVSSEHTIFAWAATAAAFGAAVAALVLALRRSDRRLLLLLALLLAYFSLDDFVEIHERLGFELAQGLGLSENVSQRFWLVLFTPLFAFALWVLWRVAENSGGRPQRYQQLAIGLLLGGVFMEAVGLVTKNLADEGRDAPHVVRAAFEEGFELGGWIILTAGLFAAFYASFEDR